VLRANLSPWEETNAAELQAERMLGLREQGSKGAAGGERVEHGLALAEARRAGREIHESVELLAFRMLHNTTASAQEGHERSASEPSEEEVPSESELSPDMEARLRAKFDDLRKLTEAICGEGFCVHT